MIVREHLSDDVLADSYLTEAIRYGVTRDPGL
jgi:hypothetical protein